MKRAKYFFMIIVILVTIQAGCRRSGSDVVVRILKAVDHSALNAVEAGIRDELRSMQNVLVVVESAQGNIGLASQVAARFASQGTSVAVGIGTMPSQCLLKYAIDGAFKLVYSSVTEPNSAGLTNKENVCGVSNFIELEQQLLLFRELQCNLKRLGMLYNPAESNSVVILQKMRTLCLEYGIVLVEMAVPRTSEVTQATAKLLADVDAIFVSNDNTILSALSNVTMVARKYKKPVYVSDTDAVLQGCLCALGPNQYKIGRQTGKMVADALFNNKSGTLEYPNCTELVINETVAAQLNIKIPEKYLKQAILVKEGGNVCFR